MNPHAQPSESPAGQEAFDLARKGETKALLALIEDGLDPDTVDAKGSSLLMLASYYGHAEMTAALAAHGANPDLRNPRGLSPLDGAAFKGDLEVIRALLAAGVPVNGQGPDGRTPLMWAAGFNQIQALRLLLDAGADAGIRDAQGADALNHAMALGATGVEAELAKSASHRQHLAQKSGSTLTH